MSHLQIFQRTWQSLRGGERSLLVKLVLSDAVVALLDLCSLAFLLLIVQQYTGNSNRVSTFFSLPTPSSLLLILCVCFFVVKAAAGYIIYRAQHRFVHRIASRMSADKMRQYLNGSYEAYVYSDSSAHVRDISLHPQEFAQHVLMSLFQVSREFCIVLVTIAAMLWFDTRIFLLLTCSLLPPLIIITRFTRKRNKTALDYIKTERSNMWKHLQEAIHGFVESNIFQSKFFFAARYGHSQEQLNRHQATLNAQQGMTIRFAELFAVAGLLLLLLVQQHFSATGDKASFVILAAFVAGAYKIIPGLSRLMNLLTQLKTYAYTLQHLPKLPAKATINQPVDELSSISIAGLRYEIDQRFILNRVNILLNKGDMLAITAASGKGKTTLLNIIAGFLPQSAGEIFFNDALTSMQSRRSSPNFSYVKQQNFFINDSVEINIRLGAPADEARLLQAMSAAGIDLKMRRHMLTENGKNISGGQRQRIAFARALYKNAACMMLDEPFSELDELSEKSMMLQLQKIARQGKIIIIVTHNEASHAYCNKILSLRPNEVSYENAL